MFIKLHMRDGSTFKIRALLKLSSVMIPACPPVSIIASSPAACSVPVIITAEIISPQYKI